jgi:hypothetical protein
MAMPIASTAAKIQTAIAVERVEEGGRTAAPLVGGEPFTDASSVGMGLLKRVVSRMRGAEAAMRSVATGVSA